MKLAIAVCAFCLAETGGIAAASSTGAQSATMVMPAPVTPPAPGVLRATAQQKTIDAPGHTADCKKTTYGNANRANSDSSTTTMIAPGAPTVISTEMRSTTTPTQTVRRF